MFNQRQAAAGGPAPSGRIPEMLEALRAEYEALQQECNYLRHHRDDFDGKVHDIGLIQKVVFDLEKSHLRIKQQYEEEIRRLKLELEACQKPINGGVSSALNFHPLPQLEQEMLSIGVSFLAAPVPGIPETTNTGYYAKRSSDNSHVGSSKTDVQVGWNHSTGKLVSSKSGEDAAPYTSMQKDKSGGYDWLVVYNPKVPRTLTVNLQHTLGHEGVVCAVRFDPTGRLLATGGNKSVKIFNAKTGDLMASMLDPEMESVQDDLYFRAIAFSPDGKHLATGSEDGLVRMWDIDSQKVLYSLEGHEQDIYTIEFFDGGSKLATGSGDKSVCLWDLKDRKCLQTLHAGTPDTTKDSGITSIAVSPNGKFLAAGSLDRLIRIWSLPTGSPVDVIEGHADSIYSIAFTADGHHLLSGSLDKTCRLWEFESADNLKGAVCKFDMTGHKDFVLSVTGSPDGKWFLTGSKDRSVMWWDTATGNIQFMLQGHKNSVIGIVFSPICGIFATASGDCKARIWSYEEGVSAQPHTQVEGKVDPEKKMRRLDDEKDDEDDEDVEDEDAMAED